MSETLVEHNCGNEKCIMCGPAPDTRDRLRPEQGEAGASGERRARSAGPGVNNNNNSSSKEAGERVTVRQIQSPGPRLHSSVPPPPPPLPKKTVAPYQV